MRIRSSLRSVGLVDSGACGESIPTSSAISMQSASITSVRPNDGSQAMTTPPITATTIPPEAVIEWGRVGGDRRDADEGASSYAEVQERDS